MPYYAHTNGTPDESQWELLKDHLKLVGRTARQFSAIFGSGEWGGLLGKWHDLGKYHPDFQRRLKGEVASCPHAPAGARFAYHRGKECSNEIAYILSYIIGGHHAGLHNRDGLYELVNRVTDEHWQAIEERMPSSFKTEVLPEVPGWLNLRNPIARDLWTRFLFSSLIDADRLMTESYGDSQRSAHRQKSRDKHLSIPDLLARFEGYITRMEMDCIHQGRAANYINIIRRQISQECLAAAYQPQGIYSCTVPTGGGKTLATMRFALHHAMRHGLDRIIVVIPYTSIIEQNARVYTDALGDANVLEHHSNLDIDKRANELGRWACYSSALASENWDIPIVVTTNVQFFESLFTRKTSRSRKVHNIANSVLIFDEAQLFPLGFVNPIVSVLRELVSNYRCSIVLSTATQPAMDSRFVKNGGLQPQEIIAFPNDLAQALQRVQIHWPQDDIAITWSELTDRIVSIGPQSLTIVNLRNDAADLAAELKAKSGDTPVFHLSALMCPRHRREKLDEIKEILRQNKPCRVVSTQLVEAGVDIDFPVVFRAMIGLDSIAQAAGRCNREGLLDIGHTYVFNPESHPPFGVLRQGASITQRMLLIHGRDLNPLDPRIQTEYFEKLYSSSSLDQKSIDSLKAKWQHEQIHDEFKIIDEDTVAVLIPWGDKGRSLLRELLAAEELKRIHFRRMQPFTVSVWRKTRKQLEEDGSIKPIVSDDENTIYYLADMSAYDEDFGLKC